MCVRAYLRARRLGGAMCLFGLLIFSERLCAPPGGHQLLVARRGGGSARRQRGCRADDAAGTLILLLLLLLLLADPDLTSHTSTITASSSLCNVINTPGVAEVSYLTGPRDPLFIFSWCKLLKSCFTSLILW